MDEKSNASLILFYFVNYFWFYMEALNIFSLSLRFKNKEHCQSLSWLWLLLIPSLPRFGWGVQDSTPSFSLIQCILNVVTALLSPSSHLLLFCSPVSNSLCKVTHPHLLSSPVFCLAQFHLFSFPHSLRFFFYLVLLTVTSFSFNFWGVSFKKYYYIQFILVVHG